ncbi:hybrid sensor histidine kinase/response regulator [Simplicispira psychrophila]|uniref:hybrid sensor histidine kinase/response regulator n=1 Tax=Simplicispira psychrophila TaxID=80882 RepID=UPI0012EBC1D3|nr:hybrid sensor histidine kinase/response regulator [Simplicispira psychrophila]
MHKLLPPATIDDATVIQLGSPAIVLPPFLQARGAMGTLIAAFDWNSTSLGPLDSWSDSMTASVALMLSSQVPMVMLWGSEGVMLYNDSYAVFAEKRHPLSLGRPVCETWPEVATFNGYVLEQCLAGETLSYKDQEFVLNRTGEPEQVWIDLDYSPLLDAAGTPVAVLAIVVNTTAKVHAEQRIGRERERLHRMFAQTPSFMAMLTGPEHVFDMANPAYMQLVGHRDVLGKPVREAIPDIEGQGFFELLDTVYRTGEVFFGNSMSALLQRTPGASPEQRYVDLVFQPLRDESDQVMGIFVEGSDVTARVQAEAAVRANEQQLREFAQAMPNHVWAARPDGQLDWFNDRLISYSGLTLEELERRPWQAMVHEEDADRAQRQWAHALLSGQPYEVEFRLRRADGSYFWHLSRAQPIRDDQGRITRWVATNTDIDEQKRTARALAHLNEDLEHQVAVRTAERDRMWRLSTDVMLVADMKGNLLSLNPAWTTLLGWTQTELLGRTFLDFIHPDDLQATRVEIGKLAKGITTYRYENRYRRKNGSYCLLLWTAVPEGGLIHAVGRDITADREAALAHKRTEAALHQAQKMESIGQLTGGLAHDFNNLLQVISGNLQLLGRAVAGQERAQGYVKSALDGVRRAAKLASQLLAFSRRQPLEPKTVNLGRFVTGLEELLHRTLGEGIAVETVVADGLWNSLVDPTQVENALLNLAINARDAMGGSGSLTIEARNALLDEAYARQQTDLVAGEYVLLSVTDTGSGMAPDVLLRAFEPFFSTKPEGHGTGLGLSMVYGFMQQSGGHVKVFSEPGQGTTVKLYLPRSLDDEAPALPAPQQEGSGGSETVLVAEDDDGVRATVVELLQQLGYQVLHARDAASALAVIDTGVHIDLLFTDVVMPGRLRSPELARIARERQPHMAVLFTSGYAQDAIVHSGRLDPGLDLLGKPYTQDALARKIRHVLAYQSRAPMLSREK